MNSQSYFDILDAATQVRIPDGLDLFPSIAARARRHSHNVSPTRKLALAALVVLLAFAMLLVTVPSFAQTIGRWLGFIPGIGIIDTSAPLRVLAESVILTRDGITVTVEEALLTADQTTITYSVSGVPSSAYPTEENIVGCFSPSYLILLDGTILEFSNGGGGGFAATYRNKATYTGMPADVNRATFVLPCLEGTLPGSQPEDWRLELFFVPAPADLTVMPVIEVPTLDPVATTANSSLNLLTLDQVIELDEGYIFIGAFHTATLMNGLTVFASDQTGRLVVTDALGKEIFTKPAPDVEPTTSTSDNFSWAFQVEGKQFAWPLKITLSQAIVSLPEKETKFDFDAGPNPQSGQEWLLNKDFDFGDYQVRLLSIERMVDGYQFLFHTDPMVMNVGVWIEDYETAGGGGGGDGQGNFSASIVYADEPPQGMLSVVISMHEVMIMQGPWSASWQPDNLEVNQPLITETADGSVCLIDNDLAELQTAPQDMNGQAVIYGLLSDGQTWGVTLSNLDGNNSQRIGSANGWAALSPNGSAIAFSDEEGLGIFHLATGQVDRFAGRDGYNIFWSPDGMQIAFIGAGQGWELYLVSVDGSSVQQLTTDGYPKAIAGWSPDGEKIYFTANSADGQMLSAIDIDTKTPQTLFSLEEASFKAAFAKISPDGNWIAYRDRHLSSLYLVRTDGTDSHVVFRQRDAAISAIEWSGAWLGLSLADASDETRSVILLQPQNCEAYSLPNLHGDLEGLKLP